ncbi:MAG: DUF1932 domain-containing protein [Caldilineaceae bacterium]
MTNPKIGLLHPGAMGVTIGAAALVDGSPVGWASDGRSEATRARAAAHPFEDLKSVDALVQWSDVILSVCPPHAALELAHSVADVGFSGIYVDANAVSPATARAVQEVVEAAGASFVDGGIIGPPARQVGTTRLYLSGSQAVQIAQCFEHSPLHAIAIGQQPGAASALKMCYAAYTKGSSALLLAICALAKAEGVDEALREEWDISQKGLADRAAGAASGSAPKAWRFEGEMREIAATFEAAGLPGGFHHGAAELYHALAGFKDSEAPALAEVVAELLA